MHFHCPHQMGMMLTLQAGDDAADVTWLEVGEHNAAYRNLYASHKQIADIVFQTHGPHIAQPSPERLSRFSALLDSASSPLGFNHLAVAGKCEAAAQALCGHASWAVAAATGGPLLFVDGGVGASDLLDINSICAAEMRGDQSRTTTARPPNRSQP